MATADHAPLLLSNKRHLRRRLQGMLDALDAGDERAFRRRLESLLKWREQGLVEGLARITRGLRAAMRQVELDSRLAQAAASDIPDACARLDAVIKLTEDAAHRTLDLVEQARARVILIEALIPSEGVSGAWVEVAAHAHALRGDMSALSEAQSYQDLSGQIIRRVMTIVGRVENALDDLLKIAGISVDDLDRTPTPAADGLEGPAVAGLERTAAQTQDDADALLADLGL